MTELIKKLVDVQSKLKAPKSQYNSFGKYKYRSAEDILEAVKPLLAENGLLLWLSDEVVQIGERFYVKATATLQGEDGTVSVTAYAREDEDKKGMDGSQITGTASSYARKYALNGLFLIDDNKDADTDAYKQQQQQPEQPQEVDMANVRAWFKAFATCFLDNNEALGNLLKNTGLRSMENLTQADADKAVMYMASYYNERNGQ